MDGPVVYPANVFDSRLRDDIIRYRLVQVWQNLKKKRPSRLAACNCLFRSFPLSFSSLSYFLSFSKQKIKVIIIALLHQLTPTSLAGVQTVVLDEVDRMLHQEFEKEVRSQTCEAAQDVDQFSFIYFFLVNTREILA